MSVASVTPPEPCPLWHRLGQKETTREAGRVSITDLPINSFHGPRDKIVDWWLESSLGSLWKRLRAEALLSDPKSEANVGKQKT